MKENDEFTFEVMNVTRIAWNDQQVDLKNDHATIIIHLHNPGDHDSFVKGTKVVMSMEDAK